MEQSNSASVCTGSAGPEWFPSEPSAQPLETVQDVKGDSLPEETPPVSVLDDPVVAWDLMASGFFVLTGQWASVNKRGWGDGSVRKVPALRAQGLSSDP